MKISRECERAATSVSDLLRSRGGSGTRRQRLGMFGHTDKAGNLQSQNSLKTFFAYEHHDLEGGGEHWIGAREEATL